MDNTTGKKFNRRMVELIVFAASVGDGGKIADAYELSVMVTDILEKIHTKKEEETK
jgi:hypothetical protein